MPRNSRSFAVVVCLVFCLSSLLCAQTAPVQVTNAVTAADSGVAFHVGKFDVAMSGEINGFYIHDRADNTPDAGVIPSCALCSASSAAQPSSSIRNGLLPGDLSFKISTREYGWDTAVFFGIWPEIQSIAPSTAFGSKVSVNVGGNGAPNALGTPGIDFRQQFVTFGRPHFGTVKIGRDLGLFGQEAILNDFTILGAGTPNGNTAPGSVTLGRIGVGYIYTDFLPQISYTTPSAGGLQAAFAVIQPLDDLTVPTLNGHGQPQFQGKLTYKVPGKGKVKANFWANFLTQSVEANTGGAVLGGSAASTGLCAPADQNASGTALCNIPATAGTVVLKAGQSVRANGVDYGLHLGVGGANFVVYGYNGTGIGITGLMLVGTQLNSTGAHTRDSQGYYAQGTYTIRKSTFGVSYGQSVLNANNALDRAALAGIVRVNGSWVGQYRYALTHWVNLVGEYTHTKSEDQTGATLSSDSVALGTIAFF